MKTLLKDPDRFVKFLTDPGDIVLDIFAGSITTGRAAEDLHRRWIAMELDQDYAAGSALRFMETSGTSPAGARIGRVGSADSSPAATPCAMAFDASRIAVRCSMANWVLGPTEGEAMQAKLTRLIVLAAVLSLAGAAAGQYGHPLKGSWSGDWGPNEDDRRRLLLLLDWDGSAVTGTINPGPNAVPVETASLDPATWSVHIEAEGEDGDGNAVVYVIDGELQNIGSYNRVLTEIVDAGRGDRRLHADSELTRSQCARPFPGAVPPPRMEPRREGWPVSPVAERSAARSRPSGGIR